MGKKNCIINPTSLQHSTIKSQKKLNHLPPPPPLRKHQENQKNDGQTGSRCLDKAVLARSNDISHG